MSKPGAAPDVVIVGASVRAAAFSALRAGLHPRCADLFADWDLASRCPAERIAPYPEGIAEVLRATPTGTPWFYTGAMENYPQLLEQLGALRPLWGNPADVVRHVRYPAQVAHVLAAARLPHPEVRTDPSGLPNDGSWLAKPLRGAGGSGIERINSQWQSAAPAHDRKRHSPRRFYYQRIVPGVSCAAVYIGFSDKATLLGVTRQLVGEADFSAKEFSYCGSIGPMVLERETQAQFQRLGDVLVGEFGLIGQFGVDCILSEGRPYPVEINPRWTASVEVLEYAIGWSAMQMHLAAFGQTKRQAVSNHSPASACVAKAILYADRRRRSPCPQQWAKLFDAQEVASDWAMPAMADIPHEGERIEAGRPMITLLVAGSCEADCLEMLRQRSRIAYQQFEPM